MKKIIIAIISAMILLPSMAEAQVKIGARHSSWKKVATIAAQWHELYELAGKYNLSMKSTCQIDSDFNLYLGTKDEAIATLTAFLEICEEEDDNYSATIDNGAGTEYHLSKSGDNLQFSEFGTRKLGHTVLHKMYIKKALKVIQKQ